MASYFVTANGRRIPEPATDQASSEMLVRTVSRYTDGKPIDRPQVCVSPDLTAGSADLAQRMATELDRRGYLPPPRPMTRAEHAAIKQEGLSEPYAAIVWDVCGRGVPLGTALNRGQWGPRGRPKSARAAQRIIKRIGWGTR